MVATRVAEQTEDFSLVLGGPTYELFLRCGLLHPPLGRLGWRIGVITAVAWLPLLLLTAASGRLAGAVPVPFLYDVEVHARLLFSLPLMIAGEMVIYARMRSFVVQFEERHIITDAQRPDFTAAISSAMRLRNSVAVEVALIVVAILVGRHAWRQALGAHSDTWYTTLTNSGPAVTPAGIWDAFVSVPIFQFVLLRWYYRVFIWCRFLYQVSRLDLNLVPLHPDRCCGTGFLGNVATAFEPLLLAQSGVASGFIANRILHDGATLLDYKFELLGTAILLLALVLGPLCVFTPKLYRARLSGLRTYGRLASDYVVDFANKWTYSGTAAGEPLLGSSDIQSLADLGNSYSVVRETKIVPFGRYAILQFIAVIALPLAPLALTMFSFEELMKRLLGILF